MLIQLLLVLFANIVLGNNAFRINNENEFIDFSKNVNRGTNYSGITVYLDSDLSLFGKIFEPIGKDNVNYFNGVFDGQGHIISGLKGNISSSQYTGLFGYSKGLTIRNVVLDSSCSITGSYKSSGYAYVGGIIGLCTADDGECNIENSVNIADVTFSGSTTGSSGFLFLGGVVGRVYSYSPHYPTYVKNCANYGSVTHSGKVSRWPFIGGIAGALSASGSFYIHLYNCLNYGTITHNGTSGSLRLGGIVGDSRYAYIENCVSAGEISTQNTPSKSYIGSIVGVIEYVAHISYCYYTTDVGINNLYGMSEPESEIETPNSTSIVNSTLIANLNNYATKNSTWNKWLLNENNASISFIINYGKGFTVNSQIVLLPDLPNSSEHNFSGWYSDANLTTLFNSNRVDPSTILYGMFCGSSKYTVTLDANGGNELGENEMAVGCMSYYGPFPENVTRTGHTLIGWFTEKEGGDKVESGDKVKILSNHTLYAHWVINNYTVSFDFYNGTAVNKTFVYNTSVEYPKDEDMKREGYIFNGWNETVINMPAQDITITALWRANNYTVTFDFDNGTIVNKAFAYNTPIEYPKEDDMKREGYTFNRWNETVINMPAQDITITALWSANNYTVIFDVNGGNELSVTSMKVTFNSQYGPLPTPTKEGHMFLGWFTDNNVSVKNEIIVSIADNHTLHTHWEEVTNQVEIVFNTKDLSREDIEDIVRKYTDAKFTISEFGEESGEVRVVIKFINSEEAVEFVRKINELIRDGDSNMIKRVCFASDSDASFSSFLYPTLFLFLL